MLCTHQLNSYLKERLAGSGKVWVKNHCSEYKLVPFFCGATAIYQKFQYDVIKDCSFIENKTVYKEGTAWNNYCFSTLKNLPTVEKLDSLKGNNL